MGRIKNLIITYQDRHRTDRVPSISEMMQAEADFHDWMDRYRADTITDEQLQDMDDNRRDAS